MCVFVNKSPMYSNNKISKVTMNVEQINYIFKTSFQS